jgi:hypothetical protein
MGTLSEVTGRQFNEAQTDVWYAAIGSYTLADCTKALYDHLSQSSGFLTPADVATRVKQMRIDRVNAAGTPPNPPEYEEGNDWEAYQAMYLKWQATWTENVANGVEPQVANRVALETVGRPLAIEATIPYRNTLALKGTETH